MKKTNQRIKRKSGQYKSQNQRHKSRFGIRVSAVVILLAVAVTGLLARAVELQVVDKGFYQKQGNNRFLRTVPMAVSRGTIFDRNGVPLAVSTPMTSLWMDPTIILDYPQKITQLAKAVGIAPQDLKHKLLQRASRRFVYLRRRMRPDIAQKVMDLKIPGLYSQREYQRYYPLGKSMAHVVGFTGLDGQGQEGLELSYDGWLTGKQGAKLVMRDGFGRVVENVEQVRAPVEAHDLTLSIDSRIQYLAYRELEKVMDKFSATSAAMLVMKPENGEVLAMASLPSFNPNDLSSSSADERRNRAMVDVFEPGSTAKAFTISAALESGKWQPDTKVDTGRGYYTIGKHTIHDDHQEGVLDVTGVITRSSNVGAAKIALSMDRDDMYKVFRQFGFGESTHSGYPGESSGLLPISRDWRKIRQATIGYGYGFNVTLMQLAQAYATIANQGVRQQPTFVKGADTPATRVLSKDISKQMRDILRTVVETPRGTAYRTARLEYYSAAGKTGTSHQAISGGYAGDVYNSLFAGMVPADKPQLVGVVVVRGAKGSYFGTIVAAPVFKAVMKEAMRILDVTPDKADAEDMVTAHMDAIDQPRSKGGSNG